MQTWPHAGPILSHRWAHTPHGAHLPVHTDQPTCASTTHKRVQPPHAHVGAHIQLTPTPTHTCVITCTRHAGESASLPLTKGADLNPSSLSCLLSRTLSARFPGNLSPSDRRMGTDHDPRLPGLMGGEARGWPRPAAGKAAGSHLHGVCEGKGLPLTRPLFFTHPGCSQHGPRASLCCPRAAAHLCCLLPSAPNPTPQTPSALRPCTEALVHVNTQVGSTCAPQLLGATVGE